MLQAIDLALRELPLAARRLISEQPGLYAEFDRLRAEAELRVAIAVPLAVAVISFVAVSDWSSSARTWAIVLAVMLLLALLWDGGLRFKAVNDLLAELLHDGVVRLPSLERLHSRAVEDSKREREAESRLGDIQAVASGNPKRMTRRAKNKLVGRAPGRSGFWRFLWR